MIILMIISIVMNWGIDVAIKFSRGSEKKQRILLSIGIVFMLIVNLFCPTFTFSFDPPAFLYAGGIIFFYTVF